MDLDLIANVDHGPAHEHDLAFVTVGMSHRGERLTRDSRWCFDRHHTDADDLGRPVRFHGCIETILTHADGGVDNRNDQKNKPMMT